MNTKHRKTLEAIFTKPVNGNIEWRKIEALLLTLGAQMIEGEGSRVTFFCMENERIFIARIQARRHCSTA